MPTISPPSSGAGSYDAPWAQCKERTPLAFRPGGFRCMRPPSRPQQVEGCGWCGGGVGGVGEPLCVCVRMRPAAVAARAEYPPAAPLAPEPAPIFDDTGRLYFDF